MSAKRKREDQEKKRDQEKSKDENSRMGVCVKVRTTQRVSFGIQLRASAQFNIGFLPRWKSCWRREKKQERRHGRELRQLLGWENLSWKKWRARFGFFGFLVLDYKCESHCFFPTEGMYHSNTTVSMQRKQLNDMIWRVVPQATCWSVPTSLNVLFQKDEKMGHPMERLATFKHITLHIWIWMKNSKNLQINVFGLDYGPLPNLPPPSHASSFDLLHCEIWVVWN